MKSELEYVVNYERKNRIGSKVQKLGKDIDILEKRIKINILE